MRQLWVYADWKGLEGPRLMGSLSSEKVRGKEIFSFEYDAEWLSSGKAQQLDPDLRLFSGPQYVTDEKSNFGLFLDSSPDRWGRVLMKRREAIIAREEKRDLKALFETDYLLGVSDTVRMGALRFKEDPDGPFLNENMSKSIPPLNSIRELEQAAKQYEDDDLGDQPQLREWLKILFAPGSSLGGARPKANVIDPDGNLWIAKFPSKTDEKDSGAWEYLVYQLAIDCGIRMAPSQADIYSRKQHTFLTKRFDRDGSNRLHFASAMTLLGYKDGHDYQEGGSYLDLVQLIERYGAEPDKDIRELWQRIVFSVAVSNTDDHLRNHGFILQPGKGWKLSPAYDLNPNPDGYGLSLNIDEADNSLDFDLCLKASGYYRWSEGDARKEIGRIKKLVSSWENKATAMKLSRAAIEGVRAAFEK